jgi:hypothetical protein
VAGGVALTALRQKVAHMHQLLPNPSVSEYSRRLDGKKFFDRV